MRANDQFQVKSDNIEEDKENIAGLDRLASEGWGEYPLDTVFVRTEQRTVGDVIARIDKGRYQLDPEFQRDFVWPPIKQSRLIESSLMRIPLPVFYVAEDITGRIIVVDGLQRLTTFYRYLNNNFSLKGLGSPDADNIISGKKFDELPIHLQERIEDTPLTLYILDSKAPEQARLDIFERVNSGVPLTRQQMRNSLYSGKATRWLKEASENPIFIDATGGSLQKKSMRDREVVNRFCAFYLLGYKSYKGDMEEFLALALKEMNLMEDDDLDHLMDEFIASMKLNKSAFKKHAFRKSAAYPNLDRTVINVSLFDVFSVVFASSLNNIDLSDPIRIRKFIHELITDADFNHAVSYSTSSTKQVKDRFKLAIDRMKEAGIC